MDDLRAQFPVLERVAYLNTGTNGPMPRAAAEAAVRSLREQAEQGRGGAAFFESVVAQLESLRERVAALMGCSPGELALTGSTTDGVNTVLLALDLRPGDEVLTSDEEHPGLLAPLAVAARRRGITVRVVPFAELAGELRPSTRLVACSHVSWINGQVVDAKALAAGGVPVLLDGAQGLGAVPLDMDALGCDFYAASGQKWLCGPNGFGYLYVRRERTEELLPAWPGYGSLATTADALALDLHEDARRFDLGFPGPHQLAWALAAMDVLEGAGIAALQARAVALAAQLSDDLSSRGFTVAPRGPSTLVSWEAEDAVELVRRLLEEGMVVRHLPGTPYVRASVGAWSSEGELRRLVWLAGRLGPPG